MSPSSQQQKRSNADNTEESQKRRRVEAPKSDKSWIEIMGTEMVNLYVGAEKKHFCVHKNLLRSKAKAFDVMFSESFKEGQESKAYFPEENPAAFALLIQWLYTEQVPSIDLAAYKKATASEGRKRVKSCNPRPKEVIAAVDDARVALHIRASLFILAEMYQATDLLDITMDSIWAGYKDILSMPTIEEISFVYEKTPEGSQLRKYMVDCCYWQVLMEIPKGLDSFIDKAIVHRDLIRDFMCLPHRNRLLGLERNPSETSSSIYHQLPLQQIQDPIVSLETNSFFFTDMEELQGSCMPFINSNAKIFGGRTSTSDCLIEEH